MRIIHFIHTLYGGVASVAANIINEQIKNNINVTVAYVNIDPAFDTMLNTTIEKVHVNVKSYPGYTMLYGMNIPQVVKMVKKRYPNEDIIVHAHNVQTVGLFTNLKGIKIVCTLHSLRGNDKGIRPIISDFIYRTILKRIIKYNGKLTSVSRAIADYYNRDRCPIEIIYNGSSARGHKKEHEKFTIGHVGNISYAKGWDLTSYGFSLVPSHIRKNMLFLSAGKPASFSIEAIKKRLEDLCINGNSKYLGFVNNAIEKLFPELDVLVLASRNEGLGLVLIEALAYGIPIIGTKVGGIPEVVEDGVNGFIVHTPEDIAKRIQMLYSDHELYKKISAQAKECFADKFTSSAMFDKYNKIYKNL